VAVQCCLQRCWRGGWVGVHPIRMLLLLPRTAWCRRLRGRSGNSGTLGPPQGVHLQALASPPELQRPASQIFRPPPDSQVLAAARCAVLPGQGCRRHRAAATTLAAVGAAAAAGDARACPGEGARTLPQQRPVQTKAGWCGICLHPPAAHCLAGR
jgi:hypothetical protein